MEETAIRRRLDVIILLLLVHLYIVSGIGSSAIVFVLVVLFLGLLATGLHNAIIETEQP